MHLNRRQTGALVLFSLTALFTSILLNHTLLVEYAWTDAGYLLAAVGVLSFIGAFDLLSPESRKRLGYGLAFALVTALLGSQAADALTVNTSQTLIRYLTIGRVLDTLVSWSLLVSIMWALARIVVFLTEDGDSRGYVAEKLDLETDEHGIPEEDQFKNE